MRKILVLGFVLAVSLQSLPAWPLDASGTPVVVTPLMSTTETASGEPIVLPQKDAQVVVSMFEIAAGASLPAHKHPFPRYAYVLAGTLQVTNLETGKVDTYKTGDFIVEMVGRWHQGANVGSDPVRLLVIDQVEKGQQNTILRQ